MTTTQARNEPQGESGAAARDVRAVLAALAKRDNEARRCPDKKLDPEKPCPVCRANSDEGCRVIVWADATFVDEVRSALLEELQ